MNGDAGSRPAVVDVGLQTERTGLAWERTALNVAVLGALLLRVGTTSSSLLRVAGALSLGAAAGVLLLGARRSRRREAALRSGVALPGPGALIGVGVVAIVVSSVALAAAVTALLVGR